MADHDEQLSDEEKVSFSIYSHFNVFSRIFNVSFSQRSIFMPVTILSIPPLGCRNRLLANSNIAS